MHFSNLLEKLGLADTCSERNFKIFKKIRHAMYCKRKGKTRNNRFIPLNNKSILTKSIVVGFLHLIFAIKC